MMIDAGGGFRRVRKEELNHIAWRRKGNGWRKEVCILFGSETNNIININMCRIHSIQGKYNKMG